MIVTAWTTIRTENKISFQIDHAWLDELPYQSDLFNMMWPAGCNIHINQDGVEFTRELKNE